MTSSHEESYFTEQELNPLSNEGRFLTTGPPGKSQESHLWKLWKVIYLFIVRHLVKFIANLDDFPFSTFWI